MPGKRPKPENIVSKLRQVEVLQGQTMPNGNLDGPKVTHGIEDFGQRPRENTVSK